MHLLYEGLRSLQSLVLVFDRENVVISALKCNNLIPVNLVHSRITRDYSVLNIGIAKLTHETTLPLQW